MMYSNNNLYGRPEPEMDMLAQIFQELFFDFANQKVNGLLVLDNKLDYIAGNEKGKEICRILFPHQDAANASCVRTAQMIKKNYQLGCFRFEAESVDYKEVFDFSLFPKALGQDRLLKCYLCTVEENGMASLNHHKSDQYEGLLTKRQAEIVELMAVGMSNREIAEKLMISEHTVHKHLENIRDRLGVSNRVGILNKLNLMYA